MSHPATLSPSPHNFMGGVSSSNFFAPGFRSAPSNDSLPPNHDRRRTSHPHNSYLQRASEEMSDRSQSQHRPRLEHRASQTIIDLTDEPEELSVPPRDHHSRNRSSRPPHLGRSDAVILNEFIDLTDDSAQQDVIFTGERQRQLPLPRRPDPPRAHSPSLFLPAARPGMHRVFAAGVLPERFQQIQALMQQGSLVMGDGRELVDHLAQYRGNAARMQELQQRMAQAMPNVLNYQNAAFADRKPEHVAPPSAKHGFTRSPAEGDVLICPSCEEELVQNNEIEEAVVKKSGKAPSRKDREEHPFWVLKECGHVSISTQVIFFVC